MSLASWVDASSPYVVDIATYGIAALGIYVALKPPDENHVRRKWLYAVLVGVLGLAGIVGSTHERKRNANELANERKKVADELQIIKTQSGSILGFVADPPKNLTKDDLEAVYRGWARDQSKIPPMNNNELRREVQAYTKKLNDLDMRLSTLWANNMLKPINLTPGQEARTRVWVDGERAIEGEFHQDYLGKGISLSDELRRRLHQTGPPPRSALDGTPFSAPEALHPLSELANYLDGLANQLPYP